MSSVVFRKLSTASTDAHSKLPRVSHKSKEYKEQVRELLQKIVSMTHRIKRSPDLYTKEVVQFIDQFRELYAQVQEHPGQNNPKFNLITTFLARVSSFYKDDMGFLVEDLMELINHFFETLHPEIRKKVVFSIMMMHKKGMLPSFKAIVFLMKLFNCHDKHLRKIIFKFIIRDIKEQNVKHKNSALNKQLQVSNKQIKKKKKKNFMVELLKKSSDNMAKRSIQIMIELYKRQIWCDTKAVNIIASGCFNNNYKVRLLSCYFLISTTENNEEEISSSEEEDGAYIMKKGKSKSVKPTKARLHRVEQEKKKSARKYRKRLEKLSSTKQHFFPLDLIHSPQDFAERLFQQLKKLQQDKFECKMAEMAVITRMINRNKLILIPFYSFLQKYIYPTQKDIPKVLSFIAEATHEVVPSDDIEPIVKHIIDQFINERCSEQAMTMGIRTILEMVKKSIEVLDKFNVNYIASYSKYRNKNVSNSAKQLINFYREENPKKLERKYRGRQWKSKAELDGESSDDEHHIKNDVVDHITGAELLQEEENQKNQKNSEIPIYYDRILTDEDFKRIRALQRKKELEEAAEKNNPNGENSFISEMDQDDEFDDTENEDDEEDLSIISGEESESGEEGEDEWEDEDEDIEIEENEDDEELIEEQLRIPQNTKNKINLKSQNLQRRKNINELEDEIEEDSVLDYYSESDEQISDENPHGFVQADQIARFKKSKSEQKKEKRELKLNDQEEKKYKHHKKKSEFASTSNKEKLKNKPLSMLRPKKNKMKNDMAETKKKISALKNQLGHVRSLKEAKKLKRQRKY